MKKVITSILCIFLMLISAHLCSAAVPSIDPSVPPYANSDSIMSPEEWNEYKDCSAYKAKQDHIETTAKQIATTSDPDTEEIHIFFRIIDIIVIIGLIYFLVLFWEKDAGPESSLNKLILGLAVYLVTSGVFYLDAFRTHTFVEHLGVMATRFFYIIGIIYSVGLIANLIKKLIKKSKQ